MAANIAKFSGNKSMHLALNLTDLQTKMCIPTVARAVGVRHRAITLQGVPHWVTAGDVRRMAERYGASGIMDGTQSS